MNWEGFLNASNIILANSDKAKIDLFMKVNNFVLNIFYKKTIKIHTDS